MKKRISMMLLLLAALMLCLAGSAGAEEYVDGKFTIYCAAEETIQPDYPDLSGRIGEGLTQDDFQITYECSAYVVTMDPATGQVSVSERGTSHARYEVFVTYTPKIDGVGKKTVFRGHLYTGVPYAYLRVYDGLAEITLGVGQSVSRRIDYNSYNVPRQPACKVENPEIVTAKLEPAREYTSANDIIMTAVAPGETTVTAYTYNGMTADIHVKVLAAPTELTFAQDVYECYAGEKLSLGVKLGDGEHMASFSEAKINHYQANDYFEGGLMGYFCHDHWGDYTLRATTYNGFSDTALIRVYDKTPAADVKLSSDIVRVGEDIKVESFDAEGNYVRARYISITKGAEIASLDADKLITTAPGEIEVTVTNLDGTTVSRAFIIEPYPTEIIFNVDELTLEIGESFEIRVGFDQGWLEHQWWGTGYPDPVPYYLYPTRFDNGVVTAQAPGQSTYRCTAGTLSKTITITVPDGDKALTVHAPENPVGVGDTFQITVKDKTGKVYPATYAMGYLEDEGEITPDGVFTALEVSMATDVSIDLEDGRHLTYEVVIVQKPLWLRHAGIVAKMGTNASLYATSDVGVIPWQDLEVTVEDERIATYKNGKFTPLKMGNTKVTIKSIYTGVTTDFTLEVRPEHDSVFIGSRSFQLPYGFTTKLPAVYDANGNEKYVKWVITHDNPGKDNPEKSGFKLDGDEITCIWPDASCEVTGYMDGASKWVRVSVFGYKMPDVIYIKPEVIVMDVGDTVAVEVCHDEPGAKFPAVYWVADTAGIIAYTEVVETAKNQFTAYKPGTTLVMAYLDNGAYALCMVTVYDPNDVPDDPTDEPDVPADRLPGDADQDGSVTIMDALAVLQYSVGWDVDISMSNADVDADGSATIMDALRILQYCVGWDAELL